MSDVHIKLSNTYDVYDYDDLNYNTEFCNALRKKVFCKIILN